MFEKLSNLEKPTIEKPKKLKKNPLEVSPAEYEAYEFASELLKTSSEYKDGRKKLNFEHTFSTGDILSATEDESGVATIVIKRGEKVVINFQKFVPDFEFTTPTYLIKNQAPKKFQNMIDGEWATDGFRIFIGEMKDIKSLVVLLHEIGHAKNYRSWKHSPRTLENWEKNTSQFARGNSEYRKQLAEELSANERDAWAKGLEIARTIKQKNGLDILEDFKDIKELKKIIYASLINHRLGIGQDMVSSDEGLIRNIWAKIEEKMFGEYSGVQQWKFMEGLFDKNKLKQKPISKK